MPNSLAMLLPSALGFSPHPPVSVYGTGTCRAIAAFLGTRPARFATFFSLRVTPPGYARRLFLPRPSCACAGFSIPRPVLPARVPAVLSACGAGIFTCCPSDTASALSLGPDFPMADQLHHGNLGYPAKRIPTSFSLLIPAFSLPVPPPRLAAAASPASGMLPYHPFRDPRLRRRVSAPDIFGAGTLG